MRVAIIGSKYVTVTDIKNYIPKTTTEIVSGGGDGVDNHAREFAVSHNIKLTEILPDYKKHGWVAPLRRNITIIENADLILFFWDGECIRIKFIINECENRNINIKVILIN